MPYTALTRKTPNSFAKHIIFYIGISILNGLTWLHPPDVHATPHSLTFGTLTEYGLRLNQYIQNNKSFTTPLTYINALTPPLPDEWEAIHQQLLAGAIIIVDGTTTLPSDVQQISAKVGGLGIKGTVVMIRQLPGKTPEYKDLLWFTPLSTNDSATININPRVAQKLADETLQMLTHWHQNSRYRTAAKPGGKVPPWKPELSIPIEVRQLGFPCLVGHHYEGNNITGYSAWDDTLVDACNNDASVSLNYSVELIRSKRSKGATHNAKIVRITMDPGDSGGAGWHLVNQPQHKHTWFESWANRETWYGPVAESYAVSLEPFDPDIRLYHAIPANHPKHSEITYTTKIEIGVAMTVGLDFPLHEQEEEACCRNDDDNAVHAGAGDGADGAHAGAADDNAAVGVDDARPVAPDGDAQGNQPAEKPCCHGKGDEAVPVDDGNAGGNDDAHPVAPDAHAHGGQAATVPQPANTSGGGEGGSCCCGGHGSSSDSGGQSSQGAGPSSTGMEAMGDDDDEESGKQKINLDPYGHESGGSCCHADGDESFSGTGESEEDEIDEEELLYRSIAKHPPLSIPQRNGLPRYSLQERQRSLSSHYQLRTRTAQFRDIGTEQSFTYESKRSIAYQNHEYEVINQAKTGTQNTASWLWTRDFDKYASHWRTNNTCPLWCDDWFFADSAFSPAAYAHFIPGFSATFMVPADKTGQSTIRFTSSIKPIALGGRVQYQFFYQKYAPFSRKGTDYHLTQDLTINWDSPIFAAEIPISLEALQSDSPDGACLTVHKTNGENNLPAYVSACQLLQNQLWGLDTELRLRSFLLYDHCLNREPDDTLSLRQCNRSISQKWKWVDNNLLNRQGGYLSISPDGSLYTSWQPEAVTAWHGFIRRPQSSDALRVDPAV